EEWLSGLTEHWKMLFGPLLVIVVLFARGGLLGLTGRLARAIQDDPMKRALQVATSLKTNLIQRASPLAHAFNNALTALSRQLTVLAQKIIERSRLLLQKGQEVLRRSVEYLTPRLRHLRESSVRATQRLRAETNGLIS